LLRRQQRRQQLQLRPKAAAGYDYQHVFGTADGISQRGRNLEVWRKRRLRQIACIAACARQFVHQRNVAAPQARMPPGARALDGERRPPGAGAHHGDLGRCLAQIHPA